MGIFLVDTDIANRALQHVGQPQLDPIQGFAENSKRAQETSFCYPKLRQAELRRNVWKFATRKAVLRPIGTTTMLLSPSLWVSITTYFVGSIVSDETGYLWVSKIPNNLGFQPAISLAAWEPYFGPLTVSLWDTTGATAYNSGELVYTTPGDGTFRTYLSLQSANSDNPASATAWDATVTYKKNDVITYLSVAYMSRIDGNINQTPTASAAEWSSATTYAIGNSVTGSDGVKYTSLANGNLNHDPTISPAFWTNTGILTPWDTTFVAGTGSVKWRQIGGAEFPMGVGLATLNIIYPIGAGPSTQLSTRNIYRLPAGFLRMAPQDPKAGGVSWLGAPSGLIYNDWELENAFIVTQDIGPIMLRFVADVVDVSTMDPMFCEGLAARIGLEVCEPLTQSTAKLGVISKIYTEWITQATTVNGIETGPTEPPLDDYLAARL